jgi:hypothetical protein
MSAPDLRIERGHADDEEQAAVVLVLRLRRVEQGPDRWRRDRIAALRRLPRN